MYLIIFLTIAGLILTRTPSEVLFTKYFDKNLNTSKFPVGSKERKQKAVLLGERIYKIILTFTYMTILFMILKQDGYEFLDIFIGGPIRNPQYFANYPCQKLPANLDNFYLFKLAYHSYELMHSLINQRNRSDFSEYFLHHFVTLALVFMSYSLGAIPVGATIMLLHDITDLGVSIFKATIDVTAKKFQIVGYASMVIPWIYFRLWFFPFQVIWPIYYEMHAVPHYVMQQTVLFFIGFLCALAVLHYFWFYLMFLGFIKRMKNLESVSLASTENKMN